MCVNRPSGECTTDAMCGAGRRCVNSVCLQRCSGPADCGTGLFCSDLGVCQVDNRPRPFCTTNAQCASGSECLDGVCRRPCASADECLRTDIAYRNCAPIAYLSTTRRYCQTDNEFRSDCGRQADCASGQRCVDGLCRSN